MTIYKVREVVNYLAMFGNVFSNPFQVAYRLVIAMVRLSLKVYLKGVSTLDTKFSTALNKEKIQLVFSTDLIYKS